MRTNEAEQSAGIGCQRGVELVGHGRRVPPAEVGAVDHPVDADGGDDEIARRTRFEVRVEPQPTERRGEVRLAALEGGHRVDPLGEEGDRPAAVREAHVEPLGAVEDTTEDERRRRQRLLVRVPHDQVEPEPSQPRVRNRSPTVIGHTVHEQWDVQFHDAVIDVVEARIVERHPVVRADVRCAETEVTDRPVELVDRRLRILQRQLRRTEQSTRVLGDQRRHRIVGRPCELGRRARFDPPEERERVRRQHLHVDPDAIHLGETPLDVHEDAVAVRDRLHRVVADPEELATVRVVTVQRTVRARGAEGVGEHDVGVQVDDDRHAQLPASATASNR